ncbi:DeSI-like protein sdu1 [Pseudocercospora fuligena]|uniref:DeSI-like protein sdu1 n=1 Tax=Pseudocercospora fuligena TaxID=685502 RepID=A0A8H6VGM3_9PEZI|nr:DeSI-like protein sdu1 [Pseudocercospora fuligena]
MSTTSKKPSRTRRSTSGSIASSSHTRNVSAQKTEIIINVYDLLPPGRLSSLLWTLGGSLLHSGICISNREYAYGGHPKRNVTGVYYTRPKYLPPGGTFRCSILQGFTFKTPEEISSTIKSVSEKFLGTDYNLLTNNCNHFTNALCEALTGKSAPNWLNRAASIGVALPCMVPREWICPPDVDTQDGEIVDEEYEDDDEDADERSGMLSGRRRREAQQRKLEEDEEEDDGLDTEDEEFGASLAGGRRLRDENRSPPPRLVSRTDSAGRPLPAAERAPVPKTTTMMTK